MASNRQISSATFLSLLAGVLLFTLSMAVPGVAQAQGQAQAQPEAQAGADSRSRAALQEGTHYTLVAPPQPTSSEADRIEVVEVFRYSCGACMTIEPLLEQWDAGKADYVDLVRLPAGWSALEQQHARAFYTAELLGKLDDMHAAFFNEIHVERNLLDSEDALARFFARFDVDEETFRKTFKSFAVHTKVQRANELISRYRVTGTPNIVVNGKYLTDGASAGSYAAWFGIIDTLAAGEHDAL